MALCLAAAWPGSAQEPPIRFRLGAEATELRPGGVLVLTVSARVPRGWHLYGMNQPTGGPVPTRLAVGPDPPFTAGAPVTASPPQGEFDVNFGLFVEWYADSARFRVPVQAARTALPGTYEAEVSISYQRCNDRICLPLATDTLRAPLTIAGPPEAALATSESVASGSASGSPLLQAAEAGARAAGPPASGGPSERTGPPEQAGPQPRHAPTTPRVAPLAASPENLPGEKTGLVARYLVLGAAIVAVLLLVLLIMRWLVVRRR